MKLIAPSLHINEDAKVESIARVISGLKGKEDPFAILSKSDLTYIQTVWTEEGYVVEYQEGSIDKHFVLSDYLKAEDVEEIFRCYLSEENAWKSKYSVWRKNVRGFWGNFGCQIGNFFGSTLRGFREARKK